MSQSPEKASQDLPLSCPSVSAHASLLLTPLRPHRPPCGSFRIQGMPCLQGVGTGCFLCLEHCTANSYMLTSFCSCITFSRKAAPTTWFKIATYSSSSDTPTSSYSVLLLIFMFIGCFLSPLLECKFHEVKDLCLYILFIQVSHAPRLSPSCCLINICLMNFIWIGEKALWKL